MKQSYDVVQVQTLSFKGAEKISQWGNTAVFIHKENPFANIRLSKEYFPAGISIQVHQKQEDFGRFPDRAVCED